METHDPEDRRRQLDAARDDKELPLLIEFFRFAVDNKKWWLIPISLVLAVVGVVIVLGSTGAAPFIYTLF